MYVCVCVCVLDIARSAVPSLEVSNYTHRH